MPQRLVGTYAPGTTCRSRPGTALRLEPGGMFELQMHYTAERRGDERSHQGRPYLPNEPSPREVRAGQFINGLFVLPAGPTTAVTTDVEFLQDTTVWALLPHTHLRGRKWEYTLCCQPVRPNDPLGTALRLQLADLLHVQGAAPACPRARRLSPPPGVRQLGGEQVEARSQGGREVGRSDLGDTRYWGSCSALSRHRRNRRSGEESVIDRAGGSGSVVAGDCIRRAARVAGRCSRPAADNGHLGRRHRPARAVALHPVPLPGGQGPDVAGDL